MQGDVSGSRAIRCRAVLGSGLNLPQWTGAMAEAAFLARCSLRPELSIVTRVRAACSYGSAPRIDFFHSFQVERGQGRQWTTREEARRDLFFTIEGYSKRQRIHSALGSIMPNQAERNASQCPVRRNGGIGGRFLRSPGGACRRCRRDACGCWRRCVRSDS